MDVDSTLELLMRLYDAEFPRATRFERGYVEYGYRTTLREIEAAELVIVDPGA